MATKAENRRRKTFMYDFLLLLGNLRPLAQVYARISLGPPALCLQAQDLRFKKCDELTDTFPRTLSFRYLG